jgi:hypothetical protein
VKLVIGQRYSSSSPSFSEQSAIEDEEEKEDGERVGPRGGRFRFAIRYFRIIFHADATVCLSCP